MIVPGKKIAEVLELSLKKEVAALKKKDKKLKLVAFLIGESADQLSFVASKRKKAERLGIDFEFIHLKKSPPFDKFANHIKEKSDDPAVTGIIIQQPLPGGLQTESIYDFVALKKEIEGHRKKSPFMPPLGLAVLTVLKYVFGGQKLTSDTYKNLEKDKILKGMLKNKKIVLVGRGMTGGGPIGKTLSHVGINYINIHSQTPHSKDYLKEADIVISAVGKRVITNDVLKQGVVLINIGVRRVKGKLKGDYDEDEVKNIASFYTPTPGGVGPIDVTYLYSNLIQASYI